MVTKQNRKYVFQIHKENSLIWDEKELMEKITVPNSRIWVA